MTSTAHPSVDVLLSEADWLRRLAGHLVRDPGTAEDIVQETLITALGAGSALPAATETAARRGWLATVARRTASRRARGEQRRSRREAAAAEAPERADPADPADVAERIDLQQQVAQALLSVDEPYRSTLFRLYYEGRTAAEVARALDVSVGTVRTRAHRGRQQLRDRLVEASGRDWTTWSLGLAPWAASPAPARVGLADAVVGRPARALLVAATLALMATVSFQLWGRRIGPPNGGETFVSPVAVADPGAEPSAIAPNERTAREAPTVAEAGGPPPATPPDPVLVMGEIVGADGAPVGGVYLTLENDVDTRKVRSGADDGTWAIPTVPPGTWRLCAFLKGYRPVHREVVVPAGSPFTLSVTMQPRLRVPVVFRKPDGTPLVGNTDSGPSSHQVMDRPIPPERRGRATDPRGALRFGPTPPTPFPLVVATATRPGDRIEPSAPGRVRRYGVGQWHERRRGQAQGVSLAPEHQGMLELDGDLPVWISLVYGDVVLESRRMTTLAEVLEFDVDPAALRALHGEVRFPVLDPVTGENRASDLLTPQTAYRVDSVTPTWVGREGDLVAIYEVPPGWHRIHVGHQHSELAKLSFDCRVRAGGIVECAPIAPRPALPFEILVVDESGAPAPIHVRADTSVRALEDVPENWNGHGIGAPSGVVQVASLPAGPVVAVIQDTRRRASFVVSFDTRESTEHEFTLPATTAIRVRRHAGERTFRADLFDANGVAVNSLGILSGTLHLEPGRYTLRRRTPAGHGPPHELVVGAEPLVFDPSDLH